MGLGGHDPATILPFYVANKIYCGMITAGV